ncbi:MAG TPA: hypothetical protein VJ761_20575 [Ktedonobacteraceae bacterium]|nr:hypothetical protein [Ktedonobacteraceae bacterium]
MTEQQPTTGERVNAADYERLASGPLVSTLEGWRGPAIPLSLSEADLGLLDLVLCVYPELRIVAYLGQIARSRELTYPIENVQQLVEAIGEDRFELGEHLIDAEQIAKAMPEEWFPLSHEGDFLTVVHRTLVRCSTEAAASRVAHLRSLAPIHTKRG